MLPNNLLIQTSETFWKSPGSYQQSSISWITSTSGFERVSAFPVPSLVHGCFITSRLRNLLFLFKSNVQSKMAQQPAQNVMRRYVADIQSIIHLGICGFIWERVAKAWVGRALRYLQRAYGSQFGCPSLVLRFSAGHRMILGSAIWKVILSIHILTIV